MNRQERRKLEKKNVVEKFNPDTQGRVKFSIELPPGLLRDDGKSSRSGQFIADNEVDLTRGMFVKLLESFGFINQQQAVIGLFASVVNPFPKSMRGALAYAIINGTGLQIVEDQVEVCTLCEAEKLMTINMENVAEVEPADECQVNSTEDTNEVCGVGRREEVHDEGHKNWLHAFEGADAPMKDTTQHAPNCEARPLVDGCIKERLVGEAVPTAPGCSHPPNADIHTMDHKDWLHNFEGDDRNVTEPQWKEITAIIVLTPVMYEPLQPKADEGVEVVEGEAEAEAEDEPEMRPDSKDALIDDKE